MIDLGLSKLAMIGVVALVVIGPEKLPRVARMAGTLYGRAQRYINQVKAEVSREIEIDELRKMHKDVKDAASDVEQSIHKSVSDTEKDIAGIWSGANKAYDGTDDTVVTAVVTEIPTTEQMAVRNKLFRRKKLARTSAVPTWFKHQSGRRTRVISGAARVAKFRPTGSGSSSPRSFH
jgi:sec-independent protein translocase protein TatB